ncbi:hypothetical protein ACIRS3_29135 [Streptomyces virginiae]|uniref:hypothetical protein n=1 Tax=Streptomyces virginiae TaxID=1961 RepID=UPI0038129685
MIGALAVSVGTVGGIYGIGVGPVLVGRGMPVAKVARAVLAATFATSLVGAAPYALLAPTTPGSISHD